MVEINKVDVDTTVDTVLHNITTLLNQNRLLIDYTLLNLYLNWTTFVFEHCKNGIPLRWTTRTIEHIDFDF